MTISPNADGVDICHNHFSNAAGDGITLYGHNLQSCKIHGNTLLHCGSDPNGAYAAIYLKEAISWVDVEDNLIVGEQWRQERNQIGC